MTKDNKQHIPVLLNEVLEYLNPKEGEVVVDATIGLGGHSRELLKRVGPKGKVVGFDKDSEALKVAKKRLGGKNIETVNGDFAGLEEALKELKIDTVDKILADLGVSSYQIDEGDRGFSFKKEGPLDMRMDIEAEFKASDIVNEYKEEDLIKIFRDYGEERFSKRIARRIVAERENKKIVTTTHLRKVIVEALPVRYTKTLKIDPSTKVFQALRIEVNGELKSLGGFLPQAIRILKKGGRLAVISFHSLEDRIVKDFFRVEAKGCICPDEFPICKCGREPSIRIITRKPIVAMEEEIRMNPRSRSAKLRVIEKI